MNQPKFTEPHQPHSARTESNPKAANPNPASLQASSDLPPSNYGIPEWTPRVAAVLLPSPKLWKQRRQAFLRSNRRWDWQFIAPAFLLMLATQSLFVWQLYRPMTASVEPFETEIEIEIPIDLSTLITEAEPESGADSTEPSVNQAAPGGQVQQAAPLAPSENAKPTLAKLSAITVPAQIIESPAASVAKAIVTAPSFAVRIPTAAATVEPTAEQGVLASEGLAQAEKIAPMLERAEQNIDAEITIAPMLTPQTLAIAEPVRPAVPIALEQVKPSFEPIKPLITQSTRIEIERPSVVTLPERVEAEILKPAAQKPALTVSEPSMPQPISLLKPEPIAAKILPSVRLNRANLAQLKPDSRVLAPERIALAVPSIALASAELPAEAKRAAAQANADADGDSQANPAATEALDVNPMSSPARAQSRAEESSSQLPSADLSGLIASGSNGSGLDLYSGIAEAAADQAAQNAPKDTRNAFRRYDDPFADNQPSRLKGLRMREPQLFLDIAKYLVRQLNVAGVGFALVQLGANEEIDDFTDADLGPLIRAWTELHHGDLTAECRRENPNLLPEMYDVLCGTNN